MKAVPKTAPGLSQELAIWAQKNLRSLIATSAPLQRVVKGDSAPEFLTHIISHPRHFREAWSEVVLALEAPGDARLRYEAEILSLALDEAQRARPISESDRAQLGRLARHFPDAAALGRELTGAKEALTGAKGEGSLSEATAGKIRRYLEDANVSLAPPSTSELQFAGHACIFCAALAIAEFGPGGAAIACLFCGLFAP